MRYCIRCNDCLAIAWVRGEVRGGGFVVSTDEEPEWQARNTNECEHQTFEVIDEEDDEPDLEVSDGR